LTTEHKSVKLNDKFRNILGDYGDMLNYTAKYTKISSGYMGQLVQWPEIVTEGKDLEDCRAMLRDALVKRHKQLDRITSNEICKQAGIQPKF
jgi:predicted RNase H-like HicB family nuclease